MEKGSSHVWGGFFMISIFEEREEANGEQTDGKVKKEDRSFKIQSIYQID